MIRRTDPGPRDAPAVGRDAGARPRRPGSLRRRVADPGSLKRTVRTRPPCRGRRGTLRRLLATAVPAALALALPRAGAASSDAALEEVARTFAPDARTIPRTTAVGGTTVPWIALSDDADSPAGFVFRTGPFVANMEGRGGPIDLGVAVTREGELLGATILASRETRAYERRVRDWLPSLAGRRIFAAPDILEVDALTGATQTSEAVLRTLQAAGHAFAEQVLGSLDAPAASPRRRRTVQPLAMLLAALGACGLRFLPSRRLRQAWLLAVALGFGVYWNLQYALDAALRLLRLDLPATAFSTTFLLVVGVPALVLVCGNLYCGWLCPFGALQELAGDARRGRFGLDPGRGTWSLMRRARFLLLAALLGVAILGRREGPAEADPLAYVFGPDRTAPLFLFAVALLVLATGFGRFWCRNLCPAGAALALLGRLSPLRRRWPRVRPDRCDFGVATPGDLDCLLCDRCRQPGAAPPRGTLTPRTRAVCLAAATVLALALWGLAARAAAAALGR